MSKFDTELTKEIQDWLEAPEDSRDITAGATMMLRLNRNRALFNSIIRRPAKFKAKLEYELRKYLKMRLADVAVADAVRIEKEVLPSVEESVAAPPVISSDDELPEARVAGGRRQDHDSLPPEIQNLWESNGPRHRQMSLLFNELKAMSDAQPCDRFEHVRLLGRLDETYRKNLKAYDEYVLPPDYKPETDIAADDADEDSGRGETGRRLNVARKTLSKFKKILLDSPDEVRAAEARAKIIEAVGAIHDLGFGIAPATREALSLLGISFPVDG